MGGAGKAKPAAQPAPLPSAPTGPAPSHSCCHARNTSCNTNAKTVVPPPVNAGPMPMNPQQARVAAPMVSSRNSRQSCSRSVEPYLASTSLFANDPTVPYPAPTVQANNASAPQYGGTVPYGTCTWLNCGNSCDGRPGDFVGKIQNGQVIRVAEIVGNRARIVSPLQGWVTTHDHSGRALIVRLSKKVLETGEPYGTRTSLRVRAGERLNTAEVGTIASGEVVRVAEIRGSRARIVKPICGWIFTKTDKNVALIVKLQEKQIRVRSLSKTPDRSNLQQ